MENGYAVVEQEDETMSSEAYSLLAQLNSEVSYGESLGVFTPKEASDWYIGADACTKISHLNGLLRYIGRFIASGLARLAKLESAVDSDLLTSGERVSYLNEGHKASYDDKGQLIRDIGHLVQRLQGLEAELVRVLNKKEIPVSDKSAVIRQFYSTSANSKGGVVSGAENIRMVAESTETRLEKSTTPDQPPVKLGVVEPSAVPIKKDPKAECMDWVEHYCKHNQFNEAADLVEASSRYFNLVEYRALLKRIEKDRIVKEVPALQAWLKAA